MTTTATCQRGLAPADRYESLRTRRCGRPSVEGDPLGRCKLHIRTDEKAAERAQADQAKRVAESERRERALELADRVRELTPGILGHVRPEYDAVIAKGYTGNVSIAPDVLERLLELAGEERQ